MPSGLDSGLDSPAHKPWQVTSYLRCRHWYAVRTEGLRLLEDVFDRFRRRFRKRLPKADRAGAVQYDLLLVQLDDLIVAEANVRAIRAVIAEQELAEVIFDARVLARSEVVVDHQGAGVAAAQQGAAVALAQRDDMLAIAQQQLVLALRLGRLAEGRHTDARTHRIVLLPQYLEHVQRALLAAQLGAHNGP